VQILFNVILVLHFLGLAAIIGTFLTQMRPPRRPSPGYLHGSLLQLVTGVAMVGLAYPLGWEPDNAKIGVKLLITLAILGLYLANRKKEELPTGAWGAIGGLAITNVAIAVFWG
jgi:hypothetical protein